MMVFGERGRHVGRPKVFDDNMADYARTLRARGVPVPQIATKRDFSAKPELARQMLVRALDAGVAAGWVADDEVYGQCTASRFAIRVTFETRRRP